MPAVTSYAPGWMCWSRAASRKYQYSRSAWVCTPPLTAWLAAVRSEAPPGTEISTLGAASAMGCVVHHQAAAPAASARATSSTSSLNRKRTT